MLTFDRNFNGFLPALSAQDGAIDFAVAGMHSFDQSPAEAGTRPFASQAASDRNVRMPKSAWTIQERSASARATSSARQKPIP